MTDRRRHFIEVRGHSASEEAPRCAGRRPLPQFVGGPENAALRLDGLRLLVVGAGSGGAPAALQLARLGPAELAIADPKNYEKHSISSQPVEPSHIGGNKAEVTARRCKAISPETRVFYYPGAIQELGLVALPGFDMVLLISDNLYAEKETGQFCTALGLPLMHASVHPETLLVQIRYFANRIADAPCPVCQYGPAEWELFSREVRFSCEGLTAGRSQPEVEGASTGSISSQGALAGSLAVIQVLRAVLDLGKPVDDTMLEYCALTHRTRINELRRNPDCPCEHRRYGHVAAERALERCSLAELAKRAGVADLLDVTVADWQWAERGICACGHQQPLERFVESGQTQAGTCARCGATLSLQPFFLRHAISAQCFEAIGHRPLRELGAEHIDWVLVRGDRAGALIHDSTHHE